MWNDATLWNVGRNTPLLEKDGGGMECWILLFFGCIFASTARTHTHHHTRAELVSICMASWHGTNEKRVGGGEGGGMAFGAQEDFHGDSNACTTAQRGGYIMGGNTLHYSLKGKYNLLIMP